MSRVVGAGTIDLPDEDATAELAARLAPELRPGDVLLLEGPLGAGKTTLVRGLVTALAGDAREVCSPTFVLLETYTVDRGGIRRLHHADLYRLRGKGSAPVEELGLDELLDDSEAVVAVEWPEGWTWVARGDGRVFLVSLEYAGSARRALVTQA